MIKMYFKQAWTLVRQHKLFTSVYVVGTGLSIALVMTMFIIFYVKFAPVYPEYNRNRTLVISTMKCQEKEKTSNCYAAQGVVYYVVRHLFDGALPHAEAIGVTVPSWGSKVRVELAGKANLEISPLYVNDGFWRVFTFRFLSGKPFGMRGVESNLPVAVISRSLSMRLFATEQSTGKYFKLDGKEFRVAGVVEDVSSATPATMADIWLPLFQTDNPDKGEESGPNGMLRGSNQIYLLAATPADKPVLKHEVEEVFRKFNAQNSFMINDLMGQPDDYWKSTFRTSSMEAPDMTKLFKDFAYILLALLFIPALNLSGMIASRMDSRLSEIGIRKAYGARNGVLIRQVLWENLLLTLVGGLAGLIFSYVIVLTSRRWILTLFSNFVNTETPPPHISMEMLMNPLVFGAALLLCIVLNLISALIPALWALRHTIIQSLNTKR